MSATTITQALKEGKLIKISAPKPANWVELYGGWEGLKKEVQKSTGIRLPTGKLDFNKTP